MCVLICAYVADYESEDDTKLGKRNKKQKKPRVMEQQHAANVGTKRVSSDAPPAPPNSNKNPKRESGEGSKPKAGSTKHLAAHSDKKLISKSSKVLVKRYCSAFGVLGEDCVSMW